MFNFVTSHFAINVILCNNLDPKSEICVQDVAFILNHGNFHHVLVLILISTPLNKIQVFIQ